MKLNDFSVRPVGAHNQALYRKSILQKLWKDQFFSLNPQDKEELDLLISLRRERVKEMCS